jgi:hypothetical protein
MPGSSALATRVAAAHLAEDERTAIELRDGAGAGYAEVADRLGIAPHDVAAVLAGARLRVREAVRGTPVPPAESPECVRARPLLAARQDGELAASADRDFLRGHVEACATCRTTRVALREGTLALRAALDAPVAVAVPAPVVAKPKPKPAVAVVAPAPARTRRRAPALIAAAVLASCVAAFAVVLIGGDSPRSSAAESRPAAATVAPTATPAATRAATKAATKKKAKKKKARKAAATATAAPVVATAAPQTTSTPAGKKKPAVVKKKTPAPAADDDSQTTAGNGGGGLPQSTGTPSPGATATPVPDSCSEDNPDCDSG